MKYFALPFTAMGSPCEIKLYADSRSYARQVARDVMQELERLEQRYSRYRDNSYLSEINRVAAKGGEIEVDEETARLLDYARTCYDQSDGLFDITSGLLRKAWDFKSGQLPSPDHIDSLLARIGWDKLQWEAPVLRFPVPGMEIDFGGVVKEFAVDRAAVCCQQAGIQHGLVNLGGDLRVVGPQADGSPWRVGIRHPRNPDAVLHTLELSAGAMASSGDYERCISLNGKRYGHVLNPTTGWPVSTLAAVTVIGDFCVVAGSASTIAMLKEDQGKAWLAELGLPHLWVDTDGNTGGSLLRD